MTSHSFVSRKILSGIERTDKLNSEGRNNKESDDALGVEPRRTGQLESLSASVHDENLKHRTDSIFLWADLPLCLSQHVGRRRFLSSKLGELSPRRGGLSEAEGGEVEAQMFVLLPSFL